MTEEEKARRATVMAALEMYMQHELRHHLFDPPKTLEQFKSELRQWVRLINMQPSDPANWRVLWT